MLSNGIHIGRRGGVRLTGGGEEGWPVSLRSSLVAFWKLDEASGNRADSVGSNTLTDGNTVTSATGLVYSNAASFAAANSEYLTVANNAGLQTGDVDFWLAAWANASTLVSNRIVVGKWGGTDEYNINYFGTTFFFTVRNTSNTANVSAQWAVSPSTSAWYFLCGWHSATDDKIYFSVNNGTPVETAISGGVRVGTEPLTIGAYTFNNAGFWDGRIGPVMFGKNYVPTAGDLTWLYNGGAGRAY